MIEWNIVSRNNSIALLWLSNVQFRLPVCICSLESTVRWSIRIDDCTRRQEMRYKLLLVFFRYQQRIIGYAYIYRDR